MPTGDTTRFPFKNFDAAPQPIIATPEQPPFAPKQFVRIKSSGTILNVARCEKRVVHGALRWVVDDLNGERAFADECELYEGVKPEVRYACTKLAAVGDTVKVIGSNPPLHMKVEEVSPTGGLYIKSPTGAWCMLLNSSQVEFAPEVTPAHPVCRGCNQPLKAENAWMSDGCPCNSERGINHGLVPKEVCTCEECAEADHIADASKMVEPPEVDYETAPVFDVMRDALQRVYDACGDRTLVNGPGNGKGKYYAIGVASAVALALDRARDELAKTPHVKFPAQTTGDGTQAGTLSVFARGWNGCLQTIRELNPDLKFEEACLDESRKFHLDLGLADRMQARAEQAESKCEELEKRLNAEDIAHGNTIDHRDTHEASINAICAALGMEEYDASWTSHNNPPERAIEYIEALQANAERLAVAMSLIANVDTKLYTFRGVELRKTSNGWAVWFPGRLAYDGERFKCPVDAALRAKELAEGGKVSA